MPRNGEDEMLEPAVLDAEPRHPLGYGLWVNPSCLGVHGGEYLVTEWNHYEIVYMPLQTRIYLYDKDVRPVSARNVRAVTSLQLPMESAIRQIPFQYVALPTGRAEQDYVAAGFDVRPLQDKDTPITFEFLGLPDRRHPTASFTPLFSRSQIRPYVAHVLPQPAIPATDGQPLGRDAIEADSASR